MKILLSSEEMRAWDRHTIEEIGIPSCVLMERASLAIAEEAEKEARKGKKKSSRILAVCGTGNNGGDGVCAARILAMRGYDSTLYLVGEESHRSEDLKSQLAIAKKAGVKVTRDLDFSAYDILIDAIFGNGLSREITKYGEVFDAIEASQAFIIAADIPSGISADKGHVMGRAVKAHVTVTMQAAKIGHMLYPGREYTGRLVKADIGIQPLSDHCHVFSMVQDDIVLIPRRKARSNKGTFGKVLVVAGSPNMSGAAYLCAKAAFKVGVGMVMILTHEANRIILQESLPEAMLRTYTNPEEAKEELTKAMDWADVVAAGPGLGTGEEAEALTKTLLLQRRKSLVLDADGLNCLKGDTTLLSEYKGPLLITPHPGEMSRLTGSSVKDILDDPIGAASELSKACGITVLLKDAATVIARPDGTLYINGSGNSGMATAGSGDVLTGICAGLLARGSFREYAAALAAYIHGAAGDLAAQKCGPSGMMAGDMISSLQEVLEEA